MKERELFQVLVARKVRKKQLVDLFAWSTQKLFICNDDEPGTVLFVGPGPCLNTSLDPDNDNQSQNADFESHLVN